MALEPSIWTANYVARYVRPQTCRDDNAYVFQFGFGPPEAERSLRSVHARYPDIVHKLHEDGAQGAVTYLVDGALVSRDMLDSAAELGFLRSHVPGLLDLNVLDIGAGYGRLAHRFRQMGHRGRYVCTDTVAMSLSLCRGYLDERGLPDVEVIEAASLASHADLAEIDLALAVHTFPEMTHASIAYWMELLGAARVPFLFLVPNLPDDLRSTEVDGTRLPFGHLLQGAGYSLAHVDLKYPEAGEPERWVYQDRHMLFCLRQEACPSVRSDSRNQPSVP